MVGIVVLNYVQYSETIRCVDSLLTQEQADYCIVIVDNGSGNESEEVLQDRYKSEPKVDFIATGGNLGFARGMNVGVDFLRERGCDFVFLANSDLVFEDVNILHDMVKEYEPGVGAINPRIRNLDGGPAVYITFKHKWMRLRMLKTYVEGQRKIHNKRNNKSNPYLTMKNSSASDGTTSVSNTTSTNVDPIKSQKFNKFIKDHVGIQQDRYEITGSGYMLTPDFFAHYKRLYPETFLGLEEYATILYLKKAGLKTCWAETAPIIHKHGASTPKNFKTNKVIYEGVKKAGFEKIFKLFFLTESGINKRYAK